jgi:hypothetical protein
MWSDRYFCPILKKLESTNDVRILVFKYQVLDLVEINLHIPKWLHESTARGTDVIKLGGAVFFKFLVKTNPPPPKIKY